MTSFRMLKIRSSSRDAIFEFHGDCTFAITKIVNLSLITHIWTFRQTFQYSILDPHGDHAEICGSSSDRVHRHDKIRDLLCQDFSRSGTQTIKEAQAPTPPPRFSKETSLSTPIFGLEGRPAAFDVNVISPVQGVYGAADLRRIRSRPSRTKEGHQLIFSRLPRTRALTSFRYASKRMAIGARSHCKHFKTLIERIAHRSAAPALNWSLLFLATATLSFAVPPTRNLTSKLPDDVTRLSL